MAEWADLSIDILVLIAKRVKFLEDYFNFYAVCKSWYSVISVLGKFQALPSRFPMVMLTDKTEITNKLIKANKYPERTKGPHYHYLDHTNGLDPRILLMEQARKDEQIEGMHIRQFYSFSASKAYEFELPEANLRKCIGVGYGLLLTLNYDLEINILNPFTREQIGMPNMLSFKTQYPYSDKFKPQKVVCSFIRRIAMSSNPYKRKDCIIMAIYGERKVLAFARPGDKVWTDIYVPHIGKYYPLYQDIVYYNGNFYAVDRKGNIVVCDINDENEPKTIPIATADPEIGLHYTFRYLVESSGDLLLVIRMRERGSYHTVGFSIFKMEESDGDNTDNYHYKFTQVKNLGNKALFIGNNASVSVPASRYVKANSIYFSDEDLMVKWNKPYGSGYDTGIYDVQSGNMTLHYASKFMSHLTPPTWIIT